MVYSEHASVASGDPVLLAPTDYHGTVLWRCTSHTSVRNLLPASCR